MPADLGGIEPAQVLGPRRLQPEQELLLALLRGALADAGVIDDHREDVNQVDQQDARAWLLGRLEAEVRITREAVCDALGIDEGALEDAVRRRLKQQRVDGVVHTLRDGRGAAAG